MEEKVCPKCKTSNPVAANFCCHCRYEFPVDSKKGLSLSPVIKIFRIKEPSYTIGSTIHLEWEVENATSIKLNDTETGGNCEAEMLVEKAERIILTAENDYDITKKELPITPSPLPSIGLYRASEESILVGQQTKLEWIVRNAQRTEVVTSDGTIVGTGDDSSVSVSPTKNEKYQLRGYSKADLKIFVEQTIAVKIIEPVQIVDFKADKESIIETEKVELSWKVENATTVEISPSVGELKKKKKADVYPKSTTIYRLTARNELSMDEATVTIVVQQLPEFDIGEAISLADLQIPSVCDADIPSIQPEYQKPLWKEVLLKPFRLTEKLFTIIDSYPNKVKQLIKKITRETK